MKRKSITVDGVTAVAKVAHATNEVIAIYPITPSSQMGELADQYSAEGEKNIWGTTPVVVEMQSEAGAAGAVHGALTTGALTTTFTASQGLLLMIPNMFKIAGELYSSVIHVSARAIACQALSIFGDHSDVMACRTTGYAMLTSNNVQETHDFALIAQAATLRSRVPFIHFFDGFRTSHEIQKIEELSSDDMRAMIDDELVRAHRSRGFNPDRPCMRGTSQNPDVYFAGRETVNTFYSACAGIVQETFDAFARITGRQYRLFDYFGPKDAERVIVLLGSGAETVEETVEYLVSKGEKVGVVKVRVMRPFSIGHFIACLPKTVKGIAVLDRTKEPGSIGEPLYEDVRTAVGEAMAKGELDRKDYPHIVGGRYGLGSAEFTPSMAKAVFDNLAAGNPKNHFTVGIIDDVALTSLEFDPDFSTESPQVHRAMFFGLGADGTIGANKNTIKIIGKATDNYAQGYFVYDSKKAGTITTSHLRFGKKPIKSTYLIQRANFVACHKFGFLEKYDMLAGIEEGGTFLLASPFDKDKIWDNLPVEVQRQIIEKKLAFYVIDALGIAEKQGLGERINTTMQTAFFLISGLLDEAKALELIKNSVVDTYSSKGDEVVNKNLKAIDAAKAGIEKVDYPNQAMSTLRMKLPVPVDSPQFVKEVTGEIIAQRGDKIPVSKMPSDGTWPTGTTKYEKRNIAENIPVWDPDVCIQCGECSLVCPHAVIRLKIYDKESLANPPSTFKHTEAKGKELAGKYFTLQVSPEDCTGCAACVNACPAYKKEGEVKTDKKAINMYPQPPLRAGEAINWQYFLDLPDTDQALIKRNTIKGSQLLVPLFEFSGACAGCGETPYIKLVSQLYGDRAIIANATGCSSIYGGNLPTTPYTTKKDGRGPCWSNSLFEDAAEFGFGMRLTCDKMAEYAGGLLEAALAAQPKLKELVEAIRSNTQATQEDIELQRINVGKLKAVFAEVNSQEAKEIVSVADYLVRRSIWIIGGDGWAYDIGYGGLDHVIASGRNVNILCLDTEVYSNTGGQMSKATQIGALAKFAANGKPFPKKDLGMMAMSYGYVYVARIAMGANKVQALKAIQEAESFEGPSLIIAYSHCISHGINMTKGQDEQRLAVESGVWNLFRFDPRRSAEGKNPLQLDSKEPTLDVDKYMYNEIRFKALKSFDPERAQIFLKQAQEDSRKRYQAYKYLADRPF